MGKEHNLYVNYLDLNQEIIDKKFPHEYCQPVMWLPITQLSRSSIHDEYVKYLESYLVNTLTSDYSYDHIREPK